MDRIVGKVGDGPEEGERHVLTDDRRRLEQALAILRQTQRVWMSGSSSSKDEKHESDSDLPARRCAA
jgi:hypothetical protein